MRRELAIAFGARVTWLSAAFAALVTGHGFVLAVDLFSAASRSALSDTLMRRELDPLPGIIRPTLGGAQLATAILVPLVVARLLGVEKERNSFGALSLAMGSPGRVLGAKLAPAAAAACTVFVAPLVLFAVYVVAGGRIDVVEVAVAVGGHLLHVLTIASVSLAAAAWTRTVTQATTIAIVASMASWAIEAGEGFTALAWLGPLEAASVSRQLLSFERGIMSMGALAWFAVAIGGALLLAWLGARFDLPPQRRAVGAVGILLATGVGLGAASDVRRAYDWTELRRASLPPAVVEELRSVSVPLTIEVWFDRDDSRRRQMERDVLAKLRLARPDARVVMPLDDGSRALVERDEGYGRLVLRAGDRTVETRSTSRREIVTLLLELAGRLPPSWDQAAYPGYPVVVEGPSRTMLATMAYAVIPGGLLIAGAALTRRRRSHP